MPEESVAERIAREKREREAENMQGLAERQRELAKGRSAADLGDKNKGTLEDNKVPQTDVVPKVDIEPTLIADGSRSPHDKTSDGGSRQKAAHAQVQALTESAAESVSGPATPSGDASVDKGVQPASDRPLSPSPVAAEDRNTGLVVTPSERQAEQVKTLREEGKEPKTAGADPNLNPITEKPRA